MASIYYNVMISYRTSKEIASLFCMIELHNSLSATKIWLILTRKDGCLLGIDATSITTHFKDGDIAMHITSNAYSYTRFKMSIEFIAVNHI